MSFGVEVTMSKWQWHTVSFKWHFWRVAAMVYTDADGKTFLYILYLAPRRDDPDSDFQSKIPSPCNRGSGKKQTFPRGKNTSFQGAIGIIF